MFFVLLGVSEVGGRISAGWGHDEVVTGVVGVGADVD